jgi:hypothetical protein
MRTPGRGPNGTGRRLRVRKGTHADSYEFGPQTWTPRLREEFSARCGYDPLPYLPAALGKIVDDPETTARFLWDFRRVRADLFAEAVGGRFRELCRREGIALTTEPHLVPDVFDQVQYGGHVSEPVGNFLAERRTRWYADNPPVGPEVHLAKGEASAAATYGLDGVVWAEAFTGVDHAHAWKESPEYLKVWGDLWLAEGINRFAFHCWAHSPPLDRKPGITLGPWGIHFDRRNTWFEMAGGYLTYLSRCQFLLQAGLPVADVAFFTGDGVTPEFPRHPVLRASGFDYHGMTAEVLVRDVTVEDGSIVLPSGMRYRLLAVYEKEMRPATIRKIRELVLAGAAVMGTKPLGAPGLSGYPASGEEVRRIAEELWGPGDGAPPSIAQVGREKVFRGEPEKPVQGTSGCGTAAYFGCAREIEVLRSLGVVPDMEYPMSGKEDGDHMLAYAHRRAGDADLYFLSNQTGARRAEECVFRTAGRRPQIWDPVTGCIRDLPVYGFRDGRTAVPLEFEPGQSYFVVFRRPAEEKTGPAPGTNFPAVEPLVELSGPWQVSFDPRWGGPEGPVVFGKLEDWSRRPEEGIRHYSGEATYRTAFDLPLPPDGRKLFLDLGRVKDRKPPASVQIRGRRGDGRRVAAAGATRTDGDDAGCVA